MPITRFDREMVEEAVLDDRDTDLTEHLANVIGAGDRQRRAALAGKVAGLELDVRVERQLLLAVFGSGRDADAIPRPGKLNAIFAEPAGQRGAGDRLLGGAAREA